MGVSGVVVVVVVVVVWKGWGSAHTPRAADFFSKLCFWHVPVASVLIRVMIFSLLYLFPFLLLCSLVIIISHTYAFVD